MTELLSKVISATFISGFIDTCQSEGMFLGGRGKRREKLRRREEGESERRECVWMTDENRN